MQYFKPPGERFAGDCMPFFHDDVFRLYYLLDQGHHQALGGLGGHQWAQASSTDLVHWTQHPLALPLSRAWEGSICTGSVLFHKGTYYAFYATRRRDWTQHLDLATSPDGINYTKSTRTPIASPAPGYSPYHFRDPMAFRDPEDGSIHLLVTAELEPFAIPGRGGCLAHLVSSNLQEWRLVEPMLIPGLPGAPECPDYFYWNGWYYLVFSNEGSARYRKSRHPYGPWLTPVVDTLDGPAARVMKTAAFGTGRRTGAAWIGTRKGNCDNGDFEFGGNIVLREIVQAADGTLKTRFLPEGLANLPDGLTGKVFLPCMEATESEETGVCLASSEGLAAAFIKDIEGPCRLSLEVSPGPGTARFGLRLRASESFDSGYDLGFYPSEHRVRLHNQEIYAVEGLGSRFRLEVVLYEDLVDVCIAGRRTLIDRLPESGGKNVWVYVFNGEVNLSMCHFECEMTLRV
jgi:hypothetical protein